MPAPDFVGGGQILYDEAQMREIYENGRGSVKVRARYSAVSYTHLGRGNESLLVPFVDSKGNFGKAYSRDMSCAAARYTEAKLEGVWCCPRCWQTWCVRP